jgi:ABC-type lipoprotein release transport system permease subunit
VGSLLIGVEPFDTVTFAVTAVVLVGTLAVAAWRPARRAAASDPALALRVE